MATVGPTTGATRRLTKKAIKDVNVRKACDKIIDPGAPIALRLQGNLLFGISRVYLQQVGYVLADTEKVHVHMQHFFKTMDRNAIVDSGSKAK